MYNDKYFIGKKIKEYRKKNSLTQEMLAEAVGLSDKHIGRIEAGKYVPNCINFMNILKVLKLDINEFGIDIKESENEKRDALLELIFLSTNDELDKILKITKIVKGIDI